MTEINAFQTEQEDFWAGEFGNEYIDRNKHPKMFSAYVTIWSKIICRTSNIKSAIEFGSNVGYNLKAIHTLLPNIDISCVEINKKAVTYLKKLKFLDTIYNDSILNFKPEKKYNLSFTRGVLIHIDPDKLNICYDLLYKSSDKYILIFEYYNPQPVEVLYRGNAKRLFKRDFAGEIMDKFSDLKLIDYGFTYHRDPNFCFGDSNWFLLKKGDKQ